MRLSLVLGKATNATMLDAAVLTSLEWVEFIDPFGDRTVLIAVPSPFGSGLSLTFPFAHLLPREPCAANCAIRRILLILGSRSVRCRSHHCFSFYRFCKSPGIANLSGNQVASGFSSVLLNKRLCLPAQWIGITNTSSMQSKVGTHRSLPSLLVTPFFVL